MTLRLGAWTLMAAAAVASGCAAETAAPASAHACSLSVSFGSYAMGIDRKAAAEVDRILAGDPGVTRIVREGAGREGEYTLCVGTRSDAAAQRLFERIQAVLPVAPRGPIRLRAGTKSVDLPRR